MSALTTIPNRLLGGFKRAFSEFLTLPLAVVIGFIGITAIIYWADGAWSAGRTPAEFSWLGKLLGDSTSLATLLSPIASSIITVKSITFSLLLIALQQGSSALTTQVTDQFLMRRSNQFYFGYFVGLSVFVLLSLVTASSIHRPVFVASLIVILTIVALCMIVVLIYNTIDQMRPIQIVRAIHRYVLRARDRETRLLAMTQRLPRADWPIVGALRSREAGHVSAIDVAMLREKVVGIGCGEVEVELRVPVGRFLAFDDPMVTLRAAPATTLDTDTLKRLEQAILAVIAFDDARDLRRDPSYGINQLSVIAWTSISTAKSNPAPGQAVIQSLRDVLSRWSSGGGEIEGDPNSFVVIGDAAPREAIGALENIILVASESIQAQTLAEAIRTVAVLLETAPAPLTGHLVDVARRALSSLGEHVLTRDLESALVDLSASLATQGFADAAGNVRSATATLATTLGTLNSRSTRVPTAA